jgi:hypothetical protein
VTSELQQFFDNHEIVLEELLHRGVTYCLDQPARLPGREIEQEGLVAKFCFYSRLQTFEAGNHAVDIGDGVLRRTRWLRVSKARFAFVKLDDREHYLTFRIAEGLSPDDKC